VGNPQDPRETVHQGRGEVSKRITQQEDIRRYVGQAIDEAVKFFNELLLPTVTYILY
jgi:hypothetical protein